VTVSDKVSSVNLATFADVAAFERWFASNHDDEREVWIKIHKVRSGKPSISPLEASDVVLCFGWIDGIRKAFDGTSYLQRYTPRRPRSAWSQLNVANVARLSREGRMRASGIEQVRAAKANGRWPQAARTRDQSPHRQHELTPPRPKRARGPAPFPEAVSKVDALRENQPGLVDGARDSRCLGGVAPSDLGRDDGPRVRCGSPRLSKAKTTAFLVGGTPYSNCRNDGMWVSVEATI